MPEQAVAPVGTCLHWVLPRFGSPRGEQADRSIPGGVVVGVVQFVQVVDEKLPFLFHMCVLAKTNRSVKQKTRYKVLA